MPPRYAYWTILIDGQPTAFRSGALEDLMPTFNRLKEKQPTAEVKWFQNGQLWASRHDAQDFMRARGDRGRERDPRQASGDASSPRLSVDKAPRDRPERAWNAKPAWKTRTSFSPASAKASAFGKATADTTEGRPAWKPKGDIGDKPAWRPKGDRPEWKPRSKDAAPEARPFAGRGEKPEWAPKGGKPEWKPKGTFKPKEPGHSSGWGEKPGWKSKGSPREQARASFRPKSYTPKGDAAEGRPFDTREAPAKRKWVPKAEYKQSLGIEVKRDDKWRPGGEHKDPKQKYKDAKKAKWTRFKQAIRARSTGKPRKREE